MHSYLDCDGLSSKHLSGGTFFLHVQNYTEQQESGKNYHWFGWVFFFFAFFCSCNPLQLVNLPTKSTAIAGPEHR